jgi:hypothetical protein
MGSSGSCEQADLIPRDRIEQSILLIRGHEVMLDSDLGFFQLLTPAFKLHSKIKRVPGS